LRAFRVWIASICISLYYSFILAALPTFGAVATMPIEDLPPLAVLIAPTACAFLVALWWILPRMSAVTQLTLRAKEGQEVYFGVYLTPVMWDRWGNGLAQVFLGFPHAYAACVALLGAQMLVGAAVAQDAMLAMLGVALLTCALGYGFAGIPWIRRDYMSVLPSLARYVKSGRTDSVALEKAVEALRPMVTWPGKGGLVEQAHRAERQKVD